MHAVGRSALWTIHRNSDRARRCSHRREDKAYTSSPQGSNAFPDHGTRCGAARYSRQNVRIVVGRNDLRQITLPPVVRRIETDIVPKVRNDDREFF